MALRRALVPALALLGLGLSARAHAGGNDLDLLSLCDRSVPEAGAGGLATCGWIRRQTGSGLIAEQVVPDAAAEARFRSLMSELGVVLAPRLLVPADTLGYAGFQISAEVGLTEINPNTAYWNAARSVSPEAPAVGRPGGLLPTVGAFLRKGVWLGLPAFELGAGAVHLLDSHFVAWQGYAKVALHEGFHDWPLPSVALRAAASYVTGSEQVRLGILGFDVIASKAFGALGFLSIEPFVGGSLLFIRARSGLIDTTPGCDAYAASQAPGLGAGPACADAQRGTRNDFLAYARFPDQDVITRQRLFAGAKLKLAPLFLTLQGEWVPKGSSRDERRPNGAQDGSGTQRSASLSAGFDF